MSEDKPDKPKVAEAEDQTDPQLSQDISALSAFAERLRIRDYVQLLQRPWRLFGLNLLMGVARGAGAAIGTILVLGLLTYLLSTIVNLPMVGKYLAGLVQEIQSHLPTK